MMNQENDTTFLKVKSYIHDILIPKVEAVHDEISDVKTEVLLIKKDTENMCKEGLERQKKIDDLDKILRGNNGNGIRGQVKSLIEWKEGQIWWQRIFISSIIVNVVLMVISILEKAYSIP